MHAALRQAYGVELTVVDLFQRTTVAAQATLIQSALGNAGLERTPARVMRQALS